MGIFRDFAPLYWGAGLPVIPLRERNKMPDITAWSAFGAEMPSEAIQQHWLASFPNGNIGLPFGSASGLCAIDIDTEDEALVSAIRDALPVTPWVRVGKKGMGLVYRWSGQKNFKLRGADGGMICEFLGLGNQMVMPPSIHPDTGQPYTANANLWEVMDDIQALPLDIEDRLRSLLGAAGFQLGAGGRSAPLDIVPAGERDVQMVRHAGYLSRVVLGIDKSATFSLSEAIDHMHHWVSQFMARKPGDDMDPGKGVAKLLEFLLKDIEKGRTLPEGWDANLPEDWESHATIQLLRSKNETQRWTVGRARDWLGGKCAENPSDTDWVLARVQDLLAAVAKDDKFTEFDMRALIPHIQRHAAQLDLKKTDLLQGFKQARKGADSEEIWEDHETIARAVMDDMQRDGEIRFHDGQFWQWNGSCFKRLPVEDIYLFIATNVKGSTIVRRHGDYQSVVSVLQRMCRGALIESEERGINFANGFVGEDLVVRDHDPKYGATFTLPFNYAPELAGRANRWFEFLHSCWGEEPDFEARVNALQEAFAATMFGIAPRYQAAFLLYGRAGTGKTVVLNVLRSMMPPAAIAELNPQHWGQRFAMTDLIGKAINICGELSESAFIDGRVFKETVEGSPIRDEFKGQDAFTFTPIAAHWFASNFMPASRDSSRGFTRRWRIWDFNKVIPETEQIKDLALIIVAEEREAIAAWALEGLRRLIQQNGYTTPACHETRIAQLRRINNSVQAFLESSPTIVIGEGEMKGRDVYDQYVFHMRDVGRGQPVSFERFIQMVEDLGLEVGRVEDAMGTWEYVLHGVSQRERKVAA